MYVFLALYTCAACSTGVDEQDMASGFFDLTQFIADYTQDSQLVTVTKTVEISESTETKTITNYPYFQDARSFENYDINRSALFDKYSVDTSRLSDEEVITHRALDPSLKVQLLQVKRHDDKVTEISIRSKVKSLLADIAVDIVFVPGQGYSLERRSNKIFQDSTVTQIEVEINH